MIRVHWRARELRRIELSPAGIGRGDAALPDWLARELNAYFRDPLHRPALAPAISGTPFQRRVWHAISAIPPGSTRTYGAIAAELGSAARAVGGACRANPCPLVVPCHRVVARRGLGGFAGDAGARLVEIKRWLLAHERAAGGRRDGGPSAAGPGSLDDASAGAAAVR
ncbi:MAG: methylated-DNA--[protein]-cysteine S-methyltransferase [Thiohalocapsa sp.]|nr:methylated-DNA--[protein]-cysteine S-methyltransferase [Thiohalocapsa sp.]